MNLTTTSFRTRRGLAAALAAAGIVAGTATVTGVAAASTEYGPPDPTPPATEAPAAPAPTPAAAPATETTVDPNAIVRTAESTLGTVLVDQEGFTLYAFLNDTDGESTCLGDCLTNWPAAAVEGGELNVGNLDPALFSTVENAEAGTMLKVGDWPLYRFAGDAAPGDVNGQAVGGVWFVVGPDGTPATIVNTRQTEEFGSVLVDAEGFTLYMFANDTEGESTCVDDCATNWPPLLVGEANIEVLDPNLYTTVEHPEGTMLKIGDWPLYRFAGDAAPGDLNGQGVGDVWFVVGPDGEAIQAPITDGAGSDPAGETATTGG
jgi:predicted lipoprotein with Yx(FWY)xxD motif